MTCDRCGKELSPGGYCACCTGLPMCHHPLEPVGCPTPGACSALLQEKRLLAGVAAMLVAAAGSEPGGRKMTKHESLGSPTYGFVTHFEDDAAFTARLIDEAQRAMAAIR